MYHTIVTVVILVLLTETLTQLAIKADIFNSIRDYLRSKSSFLDELLICGYCFSVWAAIAVNLVVYTAGDPLIYIKFNNLGALDTFINFCVSVLITHRLSNYLHGVSDRFFDTQKDIRYNNNDNMYEMVNQSNNTDSEENS